MGREVFYQAPLYPYFLALFYALFGRDLWWVRVIQIGLGAASCVFLYWAGRAFFSRAAGIAAGVILSLYAPGIFFDALIQKTVLDVFLISVLLFLLSRLRQKPRWSGWLASGAVLGLLGLSRENALVWVVVLGAWIWLYFNDVAAHLRFRWTAFILIGLIAVLLPVGMRNLYIGGEFALTTAQMGPNFFIGNNPAADGTYAPLRPGHGDPKFERQDATELAEQALGRKLSPGEVSRYWLGQAWQYISAHPFQWLGLLGKKWLMVWHVRELEDGDDFYIYGNWSDVLRGLGLAGHFGILAPLAAMGCLLTWRRWRELWVLHALVLTMAISVAVFYVFARYRFPIIPALTLLAGAGLVEAVRLSRTNLVTRKIAACALLLLVAVVVNSPAVGQPGPSAAGSNNLANAFVKQGRIKQAIESYHQALRLQPAHGVSHYNLGNLFAQQGSFDRAEHHLAKAIEIDAQHAEAYSSLADVLARQDRMEGAVQNYRSALELGLQRDALYSNLAVALVNLGRLDEALEILRESSTVNPNFAPTYHMLGQILAAQGKLDEAIGHFRRAVTIQPSFADAHESLGRAFMQQGNKQQAAAHYHQALRILKSQRNTDDRN